MSLKIVSAVGVGLALLSIWVSGGEATMCYTCSYQGPHPDLPDYRCVDAPDNVTTGSPTVNCTNGCTASSQVIIASKVIMSFARGCYYPTQSVTTACINDDSTGQRHCDLVCNTDLCNEASSIDTTSASTTKGPDNKAATSIQSMPAALLLVTAALLRLYLI